MKLPKLLSHYSVDNYPFCSLPQFIMSLSGAIITVLATVTLSFSLLVPAIFLLGFTYLSALPQMKNQLTK